MFYYYHPREYSDTGTFLSFLGTNIQYMPIKR